MLLSQLPIAPSGWVIVLPVLISHLSSRFATAILSSLFEASIPVCPDDPVIQPRAINEAHGILCTSTCVVFYKAESTGCLFDFIQTNDDALDVSTFRKQLMYLLLCGIEGEIPNIQSVALLQQLLLFIAVTLEVLVSVLADVDVGVAVQSVQFGGHVGQRPELACSYSTVSIAEQ